jgi:hypothetical protein
MRKTGMYGFINGVNIEWPTVGDLLQMADKIPIKIADLKF